MGSSFTADRAKMRVVLQELKRRGLFFVDSRTTDKSLGFDLARELGLSSAKRNVFLDNDLDLGAIEIQLERLLSMARHYGKAIGIAHPHEETVKVLRRNSSRLKQGFELVYASDLTG
jgi:polysaccharide deacetylase 2 family uncharacterized protein YibQ